MYLNDEEDEKSPDPFICDQKIYDTLRKVFELRFEDLKS